MAGFKEFLQEQEFVNLVVESFDKHTPVPGAAKPWSAKKSEIMQIWRNLRPDTPIYMTPIAKTDGERIQTYGEDGVRITGSYQFITSVLARLKEIMAYENPQSKLRLVFRGVDHSRQMNPGKNSFVFYVNLDNRGGGKPGPQS